MDIKSRERKLEENGKADLKIWTKVHRLSKTRWHRFVSAEREYTRDLPYTVTIYPHSPPRLRTIKGEEEKAISW
jgi:hypothetical protein